MVTPNNLHYPVAAEFLRRGIHVICDKPLTSSLVDAERLARQAKRSSVLFILTHNYTGYPMIRQACHIVAKGLLGRIRAVHAEYPQDWLSEPLEATGQKQAAWRTDPERSALGGSVGDIGTHAYNLLRFVTGLELDSLSADLTAFVDGRSLDDNAHVLLSFVVGARGSGAVRSRLEMRTRSRFVHMSSTVAWNGSRKKTPDKFWHTSRGESKRLITRMGAGPVDAANRVSRIPPGHPEGYLEGFSNIYREAADAIEAAREQREIPDATIFPGIVDGVEGVAFIDACVPSSNRNGAWTGLRC